MDLIRRSGYTINVGSHSFHWRKLLKNNKVEKVMKEFKEGSLHSGSKKGPKVKDRQQAIAIALSEQRKQDKGGK